MSLENVLHILEDLRCKPRLQYPENLYNIVKGELKSFYNINRLKELLSTKPTENNKTNTLHKRQK